MATEHLWAVQTEQGREVCSWQGEAGKVGDVTALLHSGEVAIQVEGETVAGPVPVPDDTELTLHRWEATDKLAVPVSHKVTAG